MALLEATNTLLDFDIMSLSPVSPVSPSFSSDSSAQQCHWPPVDHSDPVLYEMTPFLKNMNEHGKPYSEMYAYASSQSSSPDVSSAVSSSPTAVSPVDVNSNSLEMIDLSPWLPNQNVQTFASCNKSLTSVTPSRPSKSLVKGQSKRGVVFPTSSNNKLPPCRICADSASGFHYGVNSCEACKRFFRRALKRKRNFKCKGNKNCVIAGQKHNLCGYCRYKRCLALGMSKTAIKTGRYTHQKRAQDILEVQRLGVENSLLSLPEEEFQNTIRTLTSAHAKVLTNADVPLEEMYRRGREVHEEFLLRKEMFGIEEVLTLEQYEEIFQSTGLDVDERKKHMEFVVKCIDAFVQGYVIFGKGVPGFADLPVNDQANLLKLARVEVWFLSAYRGFLNDLQVFYPPNKDCRCRYELERLLGTAYTECAFRLASYLQKLDLSKEEVIVLKAVCLTFSDRCQLENAKGVEEIQWKMLGCFFHLLDKNHSDKVLFYKVMNWLIAVRNLTELSRKALTGTHFSEVIRNHSTLVDMILI